MFVTGKAGTGKSHVLRLIREHCGKRVAVVAPTGIAAINVRGQTIHSFFRLPPELLTPEKVATLDSPPRELAHVELIIIDEISMVRANLFDAIDQVLRRARGNNSRFGGAQIILFGDPFQLPPVVDQRDLHLYFVDRHGGPFFFQARVWQEAQWETHELERVFRQAEVPFLRALNLIREGGFDPEIVDILNRRVMPESPAGDQRLTTTLVGRNAAAAIINREFLERLPGPSFTYQAEVFGRFPKRDFPADESLVIRSGARVVLLANDSAHRWVNGTLATVDRLEPDRVHLVIAESTIELGRHTWEKIKHRYDPRTRSMTESIEGTFTQFPIRVAWAMTIHKAQGQTLDRVRIDLRDRLWEGGHLYVAISRCRTLAGLELSRPITAADIKVDPAVAHFHRQIRAA